MNSIPRNIFWLVFLAATIVYIVGLFVEVMDVDAAQYASISREMMDNHHYLQVLYNGKNYLDKPPLLFWLSVLSFKIFGVNTVAYKIPSFLFTLLGVYSTFHLAKRLYNEQAGWIAGLLLYTCQAFFLFNNDVRTDTILTGATIFASWQLFLFYEEKKIYRLLLGFSGVALAMMAKGPIGAVVPACAVASHIAYRREWKFFFQWQWFLGIFVALVLMLPMLYGLYEQYGLDGPKFFFWTQSFGRITGENVWKNDAGYFFFVHTFLWAFLPWSLLAVVALFSNLVRLFKNRFQKNSVIEVFSLGGFIFPFIALSFSHYKLPHYIFVVFPFAAIMCAGFLYQMMEDDYKIIRILYPIQIFVLAVLWVAATALCTYVFPMRSVIDWLVEGVLLMVTVYVFFNGKNKWQRFILTSALTAIGVNFFLDARAYPALLNYQSGSALARMALDQDIPKNEIFFLKDNINSFEFYFQSVVPSITEDELQKKITGSEKCWVIGGDDLMTILQRTHVNPRQVLEADDFSVTRLNIHFLNPDERQSQVRKKYLVQLP